MIANWTRGRAAIHFRRPALSKIAGREPGAAGEVRTAAIPGVNRPHEASQAYRLDFGPNWQQGILSIQPPKVGPAFPVLVPQVDADGNERDGVRLPEITVPLATYTAWNLRDPSIGAPDQRVSFEASYSRFLKRLPTARRPATRAVIAERYADRDDYLTRVHQSSDALGETTLDFARRSRSFHPSRGAGMGREHQVSARPLQMDLDSNIFFRLTSNRYVLA